MEEEEERVGGVMARKREKRRRGRGRGRGRERGREEEGIVCVCVGERERGAVVWLRDVLFCVCVYIVRMD